MKQNSDKNKEKISIGGLLVDSIQILQTNIIGIVWQTVKRITNEILGVKGVKHMIMTLLWKAITENFRTACDKSYFDQLSLIPNF